MPSDQAAKNVPDRGEEIRFVQVVTTVDSQEGARQLAKRAVENKLAACAQVAGPIGSVYRWQGSVQEATEWYCLFKTSLTVYPRLERLIKANHPYSVPEILAVPVVAGNYDYLRWLVENIE